MQASCSLSLKRRTNTHCFFSGKVKSPETKNIVIIGDSFIALELCGWLTTGLATGADPKEDEENKKNVSVVMLLKAPMLRKQNEEK